MARRYQIDELLRLRSSPLVAKPAALPPAEEWMGPMPDPTTQRKPTNPRDPNNPNETTPRRPSLFEARHISRGSNSEDIILGPPKTAFASASRLHGKGLADSPEQPSKHFDTDEPRNDRFAFREKFFKDRDAEDRDFDRRDGKPVPFTGRRGEREDWNSGRSRRTFGHEDPDRKPRRNGDFDRWEGRDFNRDRDQRDGNFERGGPRDKDGRFFPRRDGPPGRARHEGSWFRDENNPDGLDADEEKVSVRNREWRREKPLYPAPDRDRQWARGSKLEQEPEWLDATDKDEPRRAHTQEDFERWKEKMKAGSSQAHAEERKEAPSESGPVPSQKVEKRPTDGEIFSSNGTPFQGDAAMERFFGLLGDAKAQPQPQESPAPPPLDTSVKKEATPAPAKPMKSSRFAGLFSPPPGSPAKESTPSPIIPKVAAANVHPSGSDADQEGFQRILQMLGGGGAGAGAGRPRNATPHNDSTQSNRPPSMVQAELARASISSPSQEQMQQHPEFMSPVHGAEPMPKENMFPQDPQAREREHLLRLMQQVRVTPSANHGSLGQPQSAGPPPGLMGMAEGLPHPPPGIPTAQKGPSFIDDPAIADLPRPEAEHLRRRAANGPPLGYFEDMPFPQGNVPITPGGSRAPQQGLPGMGLQRPPGFEHLPPPGWAGHHQLPPQQGGGPGPGPGGPLAPPPGIPAPNRGVNPGYMSSMMPMPGNMPPPNERQPFSRGPPPGMMPPPGYLNGPPPGGFPPMPPNVEGLMGIAHGAQGPFEGGPGPQGPPPSSRHLLDVFGGDSRGGMVPGQFR